MAGKKRKSKNSPSDLGGSADGLPAGPPGAARGAKKAAAAADASSDRSATRTARTKSTKPASPPPAQGADEAAHADAGRNVVDASGNVLDLAQIRVRIDGVDEKIQTLISERAQL